MGLFNDLSDKASDTQAMKKLADKHQEQMTKELADKQKAQEEAKDHKNKIL